MRVKYFFFVFFSFLLFLISFYYLIAFCAVYNEIAYACVLSGLLSLVTSSTISPLTIPIIHTFIRELAMTWPNVWLFEKAYLIFNKFC